MGSDCIRSGSLLIFLLLKDCKRNRLANIFRSVGHTNILLNSIKTNNLLRMLQKFQIRKE